MQLHFPLPLLSLTLLSLTLLCLPLSTLRLLSMPLLWSHILPFLTMLSQPPLPEPAPAAVEVPAQLVSPAPHQPAAPAIPHMPPPTPKAALPVLLSQAALPQATPAAHASIHSHGPLAKEGSICESSEDKVVSTGC